MKYCPQCATPLTTRSLEGRDRHCCPDQACGFVHYANPTPVVAAIVCHQGHIVLARNVSWPEGMYGLVTGFLEQDETPEQAVIREVQEELNLTAEAAELVGLYPFSHMNQLIIAYYLEAVGEIQLNEELAGVKAVPPDKLKPWSFGTGLAVRDWLAGR